MAEGYFDKLHERLLVVSASPSAALLEVVEAYLEGKPAQVGSRNITREERDRLFWSCKASQALTVEHWRSAPVMLALVRYLSQEHLAVPSLVMRVARDSAEALIRAVRFSGLVLRHASPRHLELQSAAETSAPIAELCRVLAIFREEHEARLQLVKECRKPLDHLSAFELLVYASVYAFRHLVVAGTAQHQTDAQDSRCQVVWDCIGDLLSWKLETQDPKLLSMTDEAAGLAAVRLLRPLLFEASGPDAQQSLETLAAFERLVEAQSELNEFVSRSAESFSYSESVEFVRQGNRLEIREVDPDRRARWQRDGQKLKLLHNYWTHRASAALADVTAGGATIGRPENREANEVAYLLALKSHLRLTEVYGLGGEVRLDDGSQVPLFQALLAVNLTAAYYRRDFLQAYTQALEATGNWQQALQKLTLNGLASGLEQRFPIAWSDKQNKARNIVGWTISAEHPTGSERVAKAIVEFWTHDLKATSEKLRSGSQGLVPELLEKPALQFGKALVMLPWMLGLQDNGTAAINSLRRIGARRQEARAETQRIEQHVGRLLTSRGFHVLLNWTPSESAAKAGEIDVIAARDGHILVLEIKSTYLRRSERDAWIHATTTLRKAGRQIARKVEAVRQGLAAGDAHLVALMPSDAQPSIVGWIVDTSIESDHERCNGYLKVSLEELQIALRDDVALLRPTEELLDVLGSRDAEEPGELGLGSSLYAESFTAEQLVHAVETQAVWSGLLP